MCFSCTWGNYLKIRGPASPGGFSRRSVLLGAAAALGVGAAASFQCEAVAQPASAPADGKATMVFRNGPVYTVNGQSPWATAVAVSGRDIIYVGDEAGLANLIGPGTQTFDLQGRLLMPGFVEAHLHPIVGSTITQGIDLQFNTGGEILAVLERHRDEIGKVDVVRGFGWRYSAFPDGPSKEDLDKLWPDTPVILVAVDAHSAWVNSKALEVAKITRETADPMPGFSYFKRDSAGDATGLLVEVPAMLQVLNAAAPISYDVIVNGLKQWLPRAAAAGITSALDAGMQLVPEEDGFQLYISLAEEGLLPFRVVGSYYHNNPQIDPVPIIAKLKERFQSEYVRASILKLNMDGVDSSRTAAMLAPYSDMPETSGDPVLSKELVDDIVKRADAEGIDIHAHCIGDRAARMTLDAIEGAIAANPIRDRRHSIAHLQGIDAQDIPRFGKLGVIGQFSAQWAVPDVYWSEVTSQRWGKERADATYRFGSVLRGGGRISLGTDWPAASNFSTFNPMDALEAAVTRCELGAKGQAPLPPVDERISIEEAILANTLTAAYQLGLDDKVGSIEVGKRADLIIVDRNILDIAPDQIHEARVLLTVMDGVIRHQSG